MWIKCKKIITNEKRRHWLSALPWEERFWPRYVDELETKREHPGKERASDVLASRSWVAQRLFHVALWPPMALAQLGISESVLEPMSAALTGWVDPRQIFTSNCVLTLNVEQCAVGISRKGVGGRSRNVLPTDRNIGRDKRVGSFGPYCQRIVQLTAMPSTRPPAPRQRKSLRLWSWTGADLQQPGPGGTERAAAAAAESVLAGWVTFAHQSGSRTTINALACRPATDADKESCTASFDLFRPFPSQYGARIPARNMFDPARTVVVEISQSPSCRLLRPAHAFFHWPYSDREWQILIQKRHHSYHSPLLFSGVTLERRQAQITAGANTSRTAKSRMPENLWTSTLVTPASRVGISEVTQYAEHGNGAAVVGGANQRIDRLKPHA